ncbi:MarR family winged helix-turn-helix transcriptional regulator [Clostridium sp. JNZ X4-2]
MKRYICKEIKLQKGQFRFLTRICENPGVNQVDLSNLLKVDKTTTTKVIQKLTEADYVNRERDDSDKRMWRLYPSEKALNIYPVIIDEENRYIQVCFCNLNEKEKKSAYELVKKMRESIEDIWKKAKNF